MAALQKHPIPKPEGSIAQPSWVKADKKTCLSSRKPFGNTFQRSSVTAAGISGWKTIYEIPANGMTVTIQWGRWLVVLLSGMCQLLPGSGHTSCVLSTLPPPCKGSMQVPGTNLLWGGGYVAFSATIKWRNGHVERVLCKISQLCRD